MIQCRRFYTDKNFKNRIIASSYSLRNLKLSTRGDEQENNNILDVPRRTNIIISNIKRLNTSNSTEKNNSNNNNEENEEKLKNLLKLKRESSLRARKRIISRLKNTNELTSEINRNKKETEIKNQNKNYKRINSNNIGYNNNNLNKIYNDEIESKNSSDLNNNKMNNENKRNSYVENYYSKNQNFEIINNSNIDNGGYKSNLILYRNVRHIYKKNIIKSLVLKEKNSKIINDKEKYETKNIEQINKNLNNKKIIDTRQINTNNYNLKRNLRNLKILNGYDKDINNINYNNRNNTETNLDLIFNSHKKKFSRMNSEIIEAKTNIIQTKEIESNNNTNNIYENNGIKLKRIKTIRNNTKNDNNNNKGNKRYSYYNYLITNVKRNSFIDKDSSFKLDTYTHKTFINNKLNNQSHMINLKVLPSNNKFRSIESEKVEIKNKNKKVYDKKTFAINVFENIINICDSLDDRNNFVNLIHNFNTKYFLMNDNTYNDEYNIIFIDNQNFEYVLKHFGLVLISLIFFAKDDNLYTSYNSKIKELLIQIIYSSLNYVDMDNCYIESDIIKNFIKLNNTQSSISSIHRYVLNLINLLFDNRKEYLPLKEALEQIYSILSKKNFLFILKIINESILFCYNSKTKSSHIFPIFKFNNNMISLKIHKDAFNNINNINFNNNNNKTRTSANSKEKEKEKVKIESIPYIKTPMKNKFCLVLDIDETISHTLKLNYGGYFLLRPGTKSFLEEVCKYYEIIIFTSSPKKYADKILDKIDINGNIISHRLYKNHVLYENGKTIKNLNLIGRDLTKTIFIDNLRSNAKYNLDNLCPITTWKSDIFDNRLIKLKDKLTYIATCGKFDDDITQGL